MEIYYWFSMNFQDSYSYMSLLMTYFHDFIMMILIMILMIILYIMIWFVFNHLIDLKFLHNHLIEIIWTLIPMIILVFMALPSLKILYMFEEVINPFITVKVIGHQWYWSYEYSDVVDVEFESFMMVEVNDLDMFRLLDVDNRLVLPYNNNIRMLITSMDVIHSWALPSIGIKVDSVPGRINQIVLNVDWIGVVYGQCSEICGINHSFMPIVLESVSMEFFVDWLINLYMGNL